MPVNFGPSVAVLVAPLKITPWSQERFQKSLSNNTVNCASNKCRLKRYHAKYKPNGIDKLNGSKLFCGQTNFNFFMENMDTLPQ